jgi:hypothetical protein
MPSCSRAYLCPALPRTSALANLGCRLRLGPGKLAPVPSTTRSGPYHHEAGETAKEHRLYHYYMGERQGTTISCALKHASRSPSCAHAPAVTCYATPSGAHLRSNYAAQWTSAPLHAPLRPCALAPLRTSARILQYAYTYHTCTLYAHFEIWPSLVKPDAACSWSIYPPKALTLNPIRGVRAHNPLWRDRPLARNTSLPYHISTQAPGPTSGGRNAPHLIGGTYRKCSAPTHLRN